MMTISFIDEEANELQNFKLECNPFKIGEKVVLEVNNRDKKIWSVKEISDEFEVINIVHYFTCNYRSNHNVSEHCVTEVTLKKL